METFTLNEDSSPRAVKPRPAWVREQIRHFNRKLEPRFREKKFTLMSQSPFSFFRGTNHLFWADFGNGSLLDAYGGGKGTRIWISGDLHCDNFGCFTDPTGRLVYDVNDFDESVMADYQFDLWRLGVSLVLAGPQNKKNPKNAARLAESCVKGYWCELKSCRWYDNLRNSHWDEEQSSQSLRHFLAHSRKHLGFPTLLERWTKTGKEGLRFKLPSNPDLEVVPKETAKKLEKGLVRYAQELRPWPMEKPRVFEVQDLARRLNAGIGSEGLRRYYALVRVKENGADPYRILDIKQQVEPSAWNYLSKKSRRKTRELCGDNQALRVDLANRALTRHPDPWLGQLELKEGDFTVRERSPFKDRLPLELLDDSSAYQMGAVLARAHCRAKDSFAKKAFDNIRGNKSAFRKLMVDISLAYAAQVESDFQGFREKV